MVWHSIICGLPPTLFLTGKNLPVAPGGSRALWAGPHDNGLAVFSSFHSWCALCTALLGTANVHGAAVSVVTGAARL